MILMAIEDKKYIELNFKLKYLIDHLNFLEKESQKINLEIEKKKEETKFLKSIIDPHITITRISSKSQKDRYIGRFRLYTKQTNKPKVIPFNIGVCDKFKSENDPELLKLAKDKSFDVICRRFPEIIKNL